MKFFLACFLSTVSIRCAFESNHYLNRNDFFLVSGMRVFLLKNTLITRRKYSPQRRLSIWRLEFEIQMPISMSASTECNSGKWRNSERTTRYKKTQFTFHNFTMCANTNTFLQSVLRGINAFNRIVSQSDWFMAQAQLNAKHWPDGTQITAIKLLLYLFSFYSPHWSVCQCRKIEDEVFFGTTF